METSKKYQITAIISALNEEENIVAAIDDALNAFKKLSIDGEVLVFDDGSTDNTRIAVEAFMKVHPNIRLIRHEIPQGVGGCFWEGVHNSVSDVVVWVPGDNENYCYDVFRYLPLLQHVDIVVPFVYNQEVRSRFRRVLSKSYKAIINFSFGLLLNYMNGTVMYRRSILLNFELKNKGFFYQTELLIKTIRGGYLYAEVPQGLKLRKSGKSKAVTFRSLLRVVRGYLQTLLIIHIYDRSIKKIISESVTHERKNDVSNLLLNSAK